MMEERLQKILARLGFGSRRACEKMISEGRVSINGVPANLGSKAELTKDRIEVDGIALKNHQEPLVYVALYKPRFVLSNIDVKKGEKVAKAPKRLSVLDLVDLPVRLFPIGRLDLESEGLMILTNDGDLVNKITHPRYGHEKEYRVLVARHPDEEQLAALRRGVVLEDGYRTLPAKVWKGEEAGKGIWLHFILTEGRKRQIREMCRLIGLPVVRLVRIRIGSLKLGKLKAGEWRRLSKEEVMALQQKKPSKKEAKQ